MINRTLVVLRRMRGPLLICVAVTLVYMGFVVPGATDVEPVFGGIRKFTNVTLRQLKTVQPQINTVEKNTRLLAETTTTIHDVLDYLPTTIPVPWFEDFDIGPIVELKENAKALTATADSVHATSKNLKRDIPEVVKSVKEIDKALSKFEARTKRVMQLSRMVVWLISVVFFVQGLSLMVKPRQDVTDQTGG